MHPGSLGGWDCARRIGGRRPCFVRAPGVFLARPARPNGVNWDLMKSLMVQTTLLLGSWSFLAGDVTASDRPLVFSIHTHPGLVAGMTREDFWSGGFSAQDVVSRLKEPDFSGRVDAFLDTCVQRGISEVILDVVQPELQGIYFRSRALEELGWKPLFDVLEVVTPRARSRNLRLGVSLTELGVHGRGLYDDEYGLDRVPPLPAARLGDVLGELVKRYRLDSVTEEEFSAEWMSAARDASAGHGFRYVHRAGTDDIVGLTGVGQRTTPLAAYEGLPYLSSRDFFRLATAREETGVSNGTFALAVPGPRRLVQTSSWFSGDAFMRNLLSFRAVTSAPDEVTFLFGPEELRALPTGFLAQIDRLRSHYDPELPVLNLVVAGGPGTRLDPGHVGWLNLVVNLEPILMGTFAGAYRPVLTSRPLPDPAVHYIYLAGPEAADWMEIEKILLESGRPVLIQLGAPLPEDLLQRVLALAGVREARWRSGELPSQAFFRGHSLALRGPDFYQGNVPAGYVDFEAREDQILLSGTGGLPVIYQHPDEPERFFINGARLHRDVAFPLSQILTGGMGLQEPSSCLIGVGKRTAFWALEDTDVDWIDPRTGERVTLEMKRDGFYWVESPAAPDQPRTQAVP